MPTANAPTITRIPAAVVNTALVALNASRIGLSIHNDSTAKCWVCEGGAASATNYTTFLPPGGFWEAPEGSVYTGAINFISSAASGSVHCVQRT